MRLTDSLLSAYIDGELDAETAARVAAAVAADPAAALRLAQLRRVDRVIEEAVAWPEPEEDPLAERLAGEGTPIRPRRGLAAQALVLSLVGALAATLGWGVGRVGQAPPTLRVEPGAGLLAQGALAAALARQPSAAGADRPVEVSMSFQAADGRFCRSFVMGAMEGVACHQDGWRVLALAATAGPEAGVFRPAAGGESPVDAAIEALGVAEVLDGPAEASAIRRGWLSVSGDAAAGSASPPADR